MNFSKLPHQEKIPKPWGYEIKFTPDTLGRTGKILHINAGKRNSLQYHDQKEETLCLVSGSAVLWLENEKGELEKINMEPQKGYTIVPNQKHRIEGVENADVVEISSPEAGTTVRLEDDYKRTDETEEVRKQKNRGWNNN